MNPRSAERITRQLAEAAVVVDVGGGAFPFPRADYVIDAISYEDRGKLAGGPCRDERFRRDTWSQVDLCGGAPYPFPDKFFDFAVCSHVLEDVRDPIRVCAEMIRIAKAGYIEVPSRAVEQSKGVEHPCYAGYYHHRWLIAADARGLRFIHKPHSLHSLKAAIVADVGPWRKLNPEYEAVMFDWQGSFEPAEVLNFDERMVNRELCEVAQRFRELPDITIPILEPLEWKLKKCLYFHRLKRGLC